MAVCHLGSLCTLVGVSAVATGASVVATGVSAVFVVAGCVSVAVVDTVCVG